MTRALLPRHRPFSPSSTSVGAAPAGSKSADGGNATVSLGSAAFGAASRALFANLSAPPSRHLPDRVRRPRRVRECLEIRVVARGGVSRDPF